MSYSSFLSQSEIEEIGFKKVGDECKLSRYARFYNPDRIELGNHVRIDDFCIVSGGSGVKIGAWVHVGSYTALYGGSGIELCDYSGLSSRVAVYSESDDFRGESLIGPEIPMDFKPQYKRGKVILGKYVQIGTGSTILPSVTLHEGAVVGAHSLVAECCEAWKVYAGCPAKVKTQRSKAMLKQEARFREWLESGKRDAK